MSNIKQDSMDDYSHNENSWGSPISDTVNYYGYNEIEGENLEFIEGSSHGFRCYYSGLVTTRRHEENEFLECSVYANEISSIYDLWIQKGNSEPYMTPAKSAIEVLVYNEVTVKDKDKIKVYKYDRNGDRTLISEEVAK